MNKRRVVSYLSLIALHSSLPLSVPHAPEHDAGDDEADEDDHATDDGAFKTKKAATYSS